MIFQPGNLPVVWYREIFPGSRVIGRTVNVVCQIVSLFMQTYYSALKQGGVFLCVEKFHCVL